MKLLSVPRSPFTTPLSGSARETELRIRSILQWKKGRPPVWFITLVALAALLCGSLVSCQKGTSSPTLVMDLQYYDQLGNYVEVPALALPQGEENETVQAINGELAALAQQYRTAIQQIPQDQQGDWFRCLCYPSLSGDYLSLVLYQDSLGAYQGLIGSNPALSSWVYNWKSGHLVTEEEAWNLAGTDLAALRTQLSEEIAADPTDDWSLEELSLVGFRVGAGDQITLYLSSVHNSSHDVQVNRLYQWKDGVFAQYDSPSSHPDRDALLVPPEETMELSPALWCQWAVEGEEPEGGWDPVPISESVQNYLLAQRAIESYEYLYGVTETRLLSHTQGSRTLMLVESAGAPHVAGLDNLVLGVWDADTQEFAGDTFVMCGDRGLYSYWEADGELWLLCSNSMTYQGDETASGLGLFRFSGGDLERVVSLPQAALDCGVLPDTEEARCLLYPFDSDTQEGQRSENFWLTRLAVPGLGGFDLYEKNPAYDPHHPTVDMGEQWRYAGFVPLASLPDSVRSQASTSTRAAYGQTLEDLLFQGKLPDGTQLESSILTSAPASGYANQFAVYDVDGDGREELLLSLFSTITAGQGTYVLDYDEDADTLHLQTQAPNRLGLTPTFYENGAVFSPWSHNQGWANRFWPYDVYQYQAETDTYQYAGSVDAWDREVSDQNPDFPSFPEELDVSGSGFLYYLDGDTDTPVDQGVYLQWLDGHTDGSSPLSIQWRSLTRGNIQRLLEEG